MPQDAKAAAEEKRQKIQEVKMKIEAYWEEHKEEKASLDKELSTISDELKKIEEDLSKHQAKIDEMIAVRNSRTPFEDEIDELTKEQAELEAKLDTLGLFKVLEKRQCENRIGEIMDRLEEMVPKAKTDRLAFEANMNEQIKKVRDEMLEPIARRDEINKRITDINRTIQYAGGVAGVIVAKK